MGTITYIIWIAGLCLHLVSLYKNANQFGEKFTLYNSPRRQGRSSLNITAVLVFSLIDFHGSESRVASHWRKKGRKREKKGEKKKWKKKMKPEKKKIRHHVILYSLLIPSFHFLSFIPLTASPVFPCSLNYHFQNSGSFSV